MPKCTNKTCCRPLNFLFYGSTSLSGVYFKDELYEKWLRSGGMENVGYEGVQSALEDQGSCYLCGSSDYSLIDYYRKFDTIGLISLNDWYVLDFHLKCHDENGN